MNALRLSVRDAAFLSVLPRTIYQGKSWPQDADLKSVIASLQMRRLIHLIWRTDFPAGGGVEAEVMSTDAGREALAIWRRENPHIGLERAARDLDRGLR